MNERRRNVLDDGSGEEGAVVVEKVAKGSGLSAWFDVVSRVSSIIVGRALNVDQVIVLVNVSCMKFIQIENNQLFHLSHYSLQQWQIKKRKTKVVAK